MSGRGDAMGSQRGKRVRTLLVIDVQAGAFDGELVPAIHEGDRLLQNTARLIAATRSAGHPVVFVQHCAPAGQLLTDPGTEHVGTCGLAESGADVRSTAEIISEGIS